MSLVKIPDQSGNTVTCIQLEDGRLMPKFKLEALTNVPHLKLREDDVIICAYPKSGTHWLFEVCRMLKMKTTNLPNIEKDDFQIEFILRSELDLKPSPRILNTHYRFKDLPTDIQTVKPKLIYILRNPKDVAVSFYNHTKKLAKYYEYNGLFPDYLRLFSKGQVDYGSWFEYVKDWEQVCQNSDLPILQLTYEDLKMDGLNEIRKISDFLELERNEELFEQIKEKCSFSSMLKRKGNLCGEVNGESVMYRKGEVGDWKNWFTVADNEWFDSVYQQNMTDSKLEFVYENTTCS